jgi:2-oxoisovalerate dehydrogenase E1 component alpha subunit
MSTEPSHLRGVPKPHRGAGPAMDKLHTFKLMVRARVLEERMISMQKSGNSFFWIGGPGEEGFNVPLGLQVKKGQGLDHDYLHLHYRSSAIMLAMGMDPIDALRQAGSKATDPFSGGRNFVNHYAVPQWNVVPGSSPIEVQYSVAPGTARAQKRHGGDGITIVNGGDAGTAEADFATCLNWSSQPNWELPILILVVNNKWGISTPFDEVHGDRIIVRRAESFGIRWDVVDGNDPEASWSRLAEAMAYVRAERKPFALEAMVSRLNGHSSSSGANRVDDEPDCVRDFGERLIEEGLITRDEVDALVEQNTKEMGTLSERVRAEPEPEPSAAYDHIFTES